MTVPKAGIFAEGEGITVAKKIISIIQLKEETVLFDGKGGCFIESGKDTASILEVDMFTNSKPSTNLSESTSDNLSKKKYSQNGYDSSSESFSFVRCSRIALTSTPNS